MTIHAECLPAKGPIRSIAVYTVEGEVGCRVRELRADRAVSYRSTASIEEFIAQRAHLGPWEVTSSKGNHNGNPDDTQRGRSPEGFAADGYIEIPIEPGQGLYGKHILSGRGAYRNRLGEAE